MKRFVLLTAAFGLFLSLCAALPAQCGIGEKGFVSLFNGTDLDGWTGNPAVWSVEDGAITGKTAAEGPAKLEYNTFLIYSGKEELPSNFVLRFDIKLSNPGNSGMQYRSWVLEGDKPYRVNGYQADFDGAATYSGISYGEGFRGIVAQRGTVSEVNAEHQQSELTRFASDEELKDTVKIEDWNNYEVIADGFLFIHKINGRVMSVFVDNDKDVRRENGILAIQAHVGPPMKVQVKNVRIKAL